MTESEALMLLAVVMALCLGAVIAAIILPAEPLFDAMDEAFGDVPTLDPQQRSDRP